MKFLPITLIIVLSSSLFVALVINPVLTSLFMGIEKEDDEKSKKRPMVLAIILSTMAIILYLAEAIAFANILMLAAIFTVFNVLVLKKAIKWFQNVLLVRLEGFYERSLRYALGGRRPYWFLLGTVGLLFLSIILLGIRAPNVLFFPDNQPALINIFVAHPIGTDIEATNEFVDRMEDELFGLLEPNKGIVESVITQIGEGTGDDMDMNMGATPHKAKITISFVEFQFRDGVNTNRIMEDIRDLVEKYPGVQITVNKQTNGPPVGAPVNIESSGEDFEELIAFVSGLRERIVESNIEGIEELKSDLELGNPEVVVNINRENALRFGLSTSVIGNELRTALFGLEVSKYKDGEDDYPIQLRLADEFRYDIGALMNRKVNFMDKFGNQKNIPISAVADVQYGSSYGSVKRKDLDKVITLSSNVNDGFNPTEINNQLKELVADYDIPDGIDVRFTGEQEEQDKSSAFLLNALLIAVSLIFLIIVTQFNSIVIPFIIMATVMLSTIGVFLGLVIFNMDFVIIMTGIGIISLAGVVVNNAIVLIDYTNLVKERKRKELGLE